MKTGKKAKGLTAKARREGKSPNKKDGPEKKTEKKESGLGSPISI